MGKSVVNQLKPVVRRLRLPITAIIVLAMPRTVLMAVPLGESLSIANYGHPRAEEAQKLFDRLLETGWTAEDFEI